MLQKLSHTQKNLLAIGFAMTGLAVLLYFVFKDDNSRDAVYSTRQDQIQNVITDSTDRGMSIDRLSGQYRYLQSENERLRRQVEALAAAQQRLATKAEVKNVEEKVNSGVNLSLSDINEKISKYEKRLETINQNTQMSIAMQTSQGKEEERQPSLVVPTTVPQMTVNVSEEKHEAEAKEKGKSASDTEEVEGDESDEAGSQDFTEPPKFTVISETDDKAQAEEAAKAQALAQSEVDKKAEKQGSEVAFIPSGSIMTGTIITGGDFPTNMGAVDNPTPLLIRLQHEAILPNRYRSDIRGCFLLVGGYGELSSERAKLRGENLSCVRSDGSVIETKISAYVSGEDGKAGIRGRLVSKQGQMIARSLVAGFASGMASAFDYNPVPVVSNGDGGTVPFQSMLSGNSLKGSFAKGASGALTKISDFYMKMADQMFPVVEITAGRQVDIIVTNGASLRITKTNLE